MPSEPCRMGVGCDESGVCYAVAHGQPEQCPHNAALTPTASEATAIGAGWRPFIHQRDVPTDGTWFVARSTKPGWEATRVVRYADKFDRLPTDGTGWIWPSVPMEWMPLDEFAASPKVASAIGAEEYAVDDRSLFCRHCGKASWLHHRIVGVGNFCEPASPKVASDTAPGVPDNLAEIVERELKAWRGVNGGIYTIHAAALGVSVAILAALAASPTASDTDTAISAGGGLSERALHWRLMGLAATLRSEEFDEDNSSALDVEEAARRLTASPKPDTDTPVYPGVEGVALDDFAYDELWQAIADATRIDGGIIAISVVKFREAIRALAAKPIAGMDAGES